MKSNFKNVFLVLVCNDDGVVCLTYSELKEILNSQHDPLEWISATRHKRKARRSLLPIEDFSLSMESPASARGLFAAGALRRVAIPDPLTPAGLLPKGRIRRMHRDQHIFIESR
jgi:hypothetical protein